MTNPDYREGFAWGMWVAAAILVLGDIVGISQTALVILIVVIYDAIVFELAYTEHKNKKGNKHNVR